MEESKGLARGEGCFGVGQEHAGAQDKEGIGPGRHVLRSGLECIGCLLVSCVACTCIRESVLRLLLRMPFAATFAGGSFACCVSAPAV